MKVRHGFVSNSSSSSFIVKYTNKSGHDIKVSDIIQQNRDTFISYLDYYCAYGKDDNISMEINRELEDAINSNIVVPNNSDVLLYIESGEDCYRMSIIDFKDKRNCRIVNENISSYGLN